MCISVRLWDRMLTNWSLWDRRFTLMTVVGAASLAYKVVGVVFSALKTATFYVHFVLDVPRLSPDCPQTGLYQ